MMPATEERERPPCSCRAGCQTQSDMTAAHGTPYQFARSVWRAAGDGMVTDAEAFSAIKKYEREWLAAPAFKEPR